MKTMKDRAKARTPIFQALHLRHGSYHFNSFQKRKLNSILYINNKIISISISLGTIISQGINPL